MRRLKAAFFLFALGFGMAGSLSGCIIEDEGRGGGWHHEHHEHDWR